MPANRTHGERHIPEPRAMPDVLAQELAVLHTLPQVMQIIRTANSMLAPHVQGASPADEALSMRGLIYEVRSTLAQLGAGTLERPKPTSVGQLAA